MNKKLRTALAVILCAALAAASGCADSTSPGNTADSTTTAAPEATAESTAPASEDTTPAETAAPETSASSADTAAEPETQTEPEPDTPDTEDKLHPFKPGVWLVSDGNTEEEYYDEAYYCFSSDGSGSILSQSMGIGVPFMYEMDESDPAKGVFHIAAVDVNDRMEIVEAGEDSLRVKWEYSDLTETWTYLAPADEFSFYSSYDIGLMAERLFRMAQYAPENTAFETSLENGLVSVVIFDPTEADGTGSILKRYYIDRYTAKGTDEEGNEVDLTILEGNWEDMPYPTRFAGSPDLKQRRELSSDGSMLGVWYLGYADPWMNDYDEWRELYCYAFEQSGIIYDLRLLKSLSSYSFVTTGDGQELYFILPEDEHGSLTVTKLELDADTASLKEGEILYSTDDLNYPILLKCNANEIYSDVLIKMTDSTGRYIEWSPFISGRDGTVSTDNDTGMPIRDFTDYSKLIYPDMIAGVG